jgi:hypothetical protein
VRVGDIFRRTFGIKSEKITLKQIQDHTPKSLKYGTYASSIVSKRGNIFKNRTLDIDKMVDDSLARPLISAK